MTIRIPALVATLVIALVAVVALSAHMAYSKSVPQKDAALSESPELLQVWFTQEPEPAVSRLSLEGPHGTVTLGVTKIAPEKSIVAELKSPLNPGSYKVNWRSAGDDGHTQRGDFSFTVHAAN